jgi:hypothetical protein
MIRLQELNDGDKLPDNLLSARAAENQAKARAKGYVLLDEIDSLWNTLSAQFERAVLDGDAEWFERQAKAIRWHDSRTESQKERAQFNAEVIRRFEGAFWSTRTKQTVKQEDDDNAAALANDPAPIKFTEAMREAAHKEAERKEPERRKRRAALARYLNSPKGKAEQRAKQRAAAVSKKKSPQRYEQAATLTPGGKFTDAKARQILESFHPRKDTKPLTDKEKKFIRWHEDERWNHAEIEDMIGKSYTRNKDSELIAVSKRGGALIVEWKDRTQKFTHRFKNERCALDAIRDIANQLQIELNGF